MMASKRKIKGPKKATRRHQRRAPHPSHRSHQHAEFPVRGITFDLCCGEMAVASGLGNNRGEFKIRMDAHGFEVTILLSEDRAQDLVDGLGGCIAEARKGVN